jgi:hypothetical protein
MTDQDREAFATLMLGLGETYGEPVSAARMEIYFTALADLELDAVRAAVTAHVQGVKFFPRPAEIREAVAGSTDDRAALAWNAVLRLVRRIGYPGTDGRGAPPAFPDRACERAALELFGGWRALCERLPGEGPELLGIAKNFKAAYAAYVRRDQRTLDALPPTADEARAVLADVKTQLQKRGLPTGAL